jgi:methylase of polypeptide subunit release factors
MKSFFYKAYLQIINRVRVNNAIHRLLFGYSPCIGSSEHGSYWDWTTLALKKAIKQYLKPSDKFLDVGTGTVGVLAIYAKHTIKCDYVDAIDYVPEIVLQSKKISDSLGLKIQFILSDLFENVNNTYDMIVFNSPYLDVVRGKEFGIIKDEISEKRFSGGNKGGETVSRFLSEAQHYLSADGKIALGVNHFHINKSTVQDIISASPFLILDCISNKFQGAAYLLGRKLNNRNRG